MEKINHKRGRSGTSSLFFPGLYRNFSVLTQKCPVLAPGVNCTLLTWVMTELLNTLHEIHPHPYILMQIFFQINFEKKIKNLLLQADVVPAMILRREDPRSDRRSNTWENLEIRKRCSYWTTVISSFCETDMQSLIQILGGHWVLWENIRGCSGHKKGLFFVGGCCPISHISLGRSIPHCGYQFTWLFLSSPVLHTQCVLKQLCVCWLQCPWELSRLSLVKATLLPLCIFLFKFVYCCSFSKSWQKYTIEKLVLGYKDIYSKISENQLLS